MFKESETYSGETWRKQNIYREIPKIMLKAKKWM